MVVEALQVMGFFFLLPLPSLLLLFFFFETGFLCVALAVLELALWTRLVLNSEIPVSVS